MMHIHAYLFVFVLLKFQYQTSSDHESYISHFHGKLFSAEKKRLRINKRKEFGPTLRNGPFSFASFKKQVMVYPNITTSHLICVEMPAILLPFLNRFADILVVTNLHALIYFQLNLTFLAL